MVNVLCTIHSWVLGEGWDNFGLSLGIPIIEKIGITNSPILLKILDTFYVGDIQRNMLVLETFFGGPV